MTSGLQQWTLDQRRAVLESVLYHQRAGRVESQGYVQAVVVWQTSPTHVLHIILSLVTFGLWLPVYAVAAAMSKTIRRTYFVDEYGRLWCNGQYVPPVE